MAVKEIHIEGKVQIQKWAEDNNDLIMSVLYENVFDFVESTEDMRVVMKIISGSNKPRRGRVKYAGSIIEFMISREDIHDTIDSLFKHMVINEEYEKCIELQELKKRVSV